MQKLHSLTKIVAVLASTGLLMTACKKDYNQSSRSGSTSTQSGTASKAPQDTGPGTGINDMTHSGIGGAGMDSSMKTDSSMKMDTSKHAGKMDTSKHGKGHMGKKAKAGKAHKDSSMTDTTHAGTGGTGTKGKGGSDVQLPNPGSGTGGSSMPSGGGMGY